MKRVLNIYRNLRGLRLWRLLLEINFVTDGAFRETLMYKIIHPARDMCNDSTVTRDPLIISLKIKLY